MNHSCRPNPSLFKDLAEQAQQLDYILACDQLELLHYAFEVKIANYTKDQLVFLHYFMFQYQRTLQRDKRSLVGTYLSLIKHRLNKIE